MMIGQRKFYISKAINGCTPLFMGAEDTYEAAQAKADEMKAFHLERCPQDRVDMLIREVRL